MKTRRRSPRLRLVARPGAKAPGGPSAGPAGGAAPGKTVRAEHAPASDRAAVVPIRRGGPAGATQRLAFLVARLGNNEVAGLIGVSPSQPSRWRRGEERMSAESERRVLDLDYVIGRLLRLYPPRQAGIWLESHNAHLGSRPIDALRLRGVEPVIRALDAEEQGAYA